MIGEFIARELQEDLAGADAAMDSILKAGN